jgi:Family of unknown function (DUF5670)
MPPVFKGELTPVALVFVALWVVGLVSSYTLGGFLHLFLLVAIVLMLPRIIWGRKQAE